MANRNEKILNITNHQRNANQKQYEISSHTCQNVYHQYINKQVLARSGEKGTLVYYWQKCRLRQPLKKTVCTFLKKLKTDIPYDLAIPLWGIYLEKKNIKKDICFPMLLAALFTIDKIWKQSRYPSIDELIKMWYTYTHIYIYI